MPETKVITEVQSQRLICI